MIESNKDLDWRFGSEDATDVASWSKSAAEAESAIPEGTDQSDQSRFRTFYEWMLVIAVLYGAALTLIWQQLRQDIVQLEAELSSMHDELSRIHELEAETSLATASPYTYETEHLRFVASRETTGFVAEILNESDTHYSQLRDQLRIPLSPDLAKPTIFVDRMIHPDHRSIEGVKIYVGHPKFKANRYRLRESDALAQEVSDRLSQHLLDTAIHKRNIPLRWHAMAMALGAHLNLNGGYKPTWQFESTFLAYRHQAQDHPLQLTQKVYHAVDNHLDPSPSYTAQAYQAANPLAEFIIDTYGHRTMPALLDAFEAYETWETLSPAVFGVSATELEEQWHAYLRRKYPRPKEPDAEQASNPLHRALP